MTGVASLAGGELSTAVEPENVTAGGVGFLVIAGLVVGTVFLLRSMNKQLKKVDFEEAPDEAEAADDVRPDDAAPDDAAGEPETATGDKPEEGPKSPRE